MEGFYVANLYCLRLGRLGNAWIFRVGGSYVANLYCLTLGRLGNAWNFGSGGLRYRRLGSVVMLEGLRFGRLGRLGNEWRLGRPGRPRSDEGLEWSRCRPITLDALRGRRIN